jgi:hypothetical protein
VLGAQQRPDGRDECFELVFCERRSPLDRDGPVDVSDRISVPVLERSSLRIEVASELYEAAFVTHEQAATSFGLANHPDVHGGEAELVVPKHALRSDPEVPFDVPIENLDIGRSLEGVILSECSRNSFRCLKELLEQDGPGVSVDRTEPRLVRSGNKTRGFGALGDELGVLLVNVQGKSNLLDLSFSNIYSARSTVVLPNDLFIMPFLGITVNRRVKGRETGRHNGGGLSLKQMRETRHSAPAGCR